VVICVVVLWWLKTCQLFENIFLNIALPQLDSELDFGVVCIRGYRGAAGFGGEQRESRV
jgi:hypothetical protein